MLHQSITELLQYWRDAAIIEAAEQYTNREEAMDTIAQWDDDKQADFAERFAAGAFYVSPENR